MPDEESKKNLFELFNNVMAEKEPDVNVIENEDNVQWFRHINVLNVKVDKLICKLSSYYLSVNAHSLFAVLLEK